MKKKIWKNPDTNNEWKKENLNTIMLRMKESQLKTFKQTYDEKLEFGKLVYSKNSKKKP